MAACPVRVIERHGWQRRCISRCASYVFRFVSASFVLASGRSRKEALYVSSLELFVQSVMLHTERHGWDYVSIRSMNMYRTFFLCSAFPDRATFYWVTFVRNPPSPRCCCCMLKHSIDRGAIRRVWRCPHPRRQNHYHHIYLYVRLSTGQ